ncbi:calcium calmodulin-dependent 3 -cyclic nucleotide phosphodiesterase 1b [Pelomyxa schiedti]|nr:calcium calmodulin-dependent 3 -cyclic nucleotide phosphodiesterase 1b [Pelomyxa schiedti]
MRRSRFPPGGVVPVVAVASLMLLLSTISTTAAGGVSQGGPAETRAEATAASATGEEWGVCTMEGMLALTATTSDSVEPLFVQIQSRGVTKGAGLDYHTNREIETYIRLASLIPVPINLNDSCSCNPYWRLWHIEHPYAGDGWGLSCEHFCTMSRLLAMSVHLQSVIPHFWEYTRGVTKMWSFVNDDLWGMYITPWSIWRSWNITLVEYSGTPNFTAAFYPFIKPDVNPERLSYWSDPYFPGWEMQIQFITPLYDYEDNFLGGIYATLAMSGTTSVFESLVSTPGGFGLLLSTRGCVLTASKAAYTTLFGSYNFSTLTSSCLYNSNCLANFSQFLSELTEPGYSSITLRDQEWIFTRRPMESMSWVLSIATPVKNLISDDDFEIFPQSVVLIVEQSKSINFNLTLINRGRVPLHALLITNSSSWLTTSWPQDGIPVSTGNASVYFSYKGGILPFSTSIMVTVHDSATKFSLCFSKSYSVPIDIRLVHKSKTAVVGATVGSFSFLLLLCLIAAVFVVYHFRNKASRSFYMHSHLLNTPAEESIKKLISIRNKTRRLSTEDHASLDKIIHLIASDGLHRADYIAKKKIDIDAEVDAYLQEQLVESKLGKDSEEVIVPSGEVVSPEACADPGMLDQWSFPIFEFHLEGALSHLAFTVFKRHDLITKFLIDEDLFQGWLGDITNGVHAADVLQALNVFVLNLEKEIPPFAKLCLFTSGIIHDFNHPGVNSNFLYRLLDPLAFKYNGISILENMHATEAFKLTLNGENNWLKCLSHEKLLEFHRMVTRCVLATDMASHVDLLSHFKTRIASAALDYTVEDDVVLVLKMLLKLADVSNPIRPWDTCHRWASLFTEEWYRQGDQEETHQMPKSPFADRLTPNLPKAQSTFISFVVAPLLTCVSQLFTPSLSSGLHTVLESNYSTWQSKLSS